MPTIDQVIDEPQTLQGLFPPDSDDSDDGDADPTTRNSACFEIQSLTLTGCTLRVRQFDYHSHNANRVWPGTFNLSDYLLEQVEPERQIAEATPDTTVSISAPCGTSGSSDTGTTAVSSIRYKHQWGRILELGTATGLLAMRLALASSMHRTSGGAGDDHDTHPAFCCTSIVTSDVQDEGDEIAANVRFNYELNGLLDRDAPPHVPHTWGTGWDTSVQAAHRSNEYATWYNPNTLSLVPFDTIVASDILLYVSAYPALVQTLTELFALSSSTIFVMSWNRRMKESAEFFERMEQAGFTWTHQGKCIYTFRTNKSGDTTATSASTLLPPEV